MIAEDYVSFETAKLLKKKGFDGCPLFRYDDCGQLWITGGYNKTIKWHFPAPTLQMAMRWLREVHNIDVWIHPVRRDTKLYEASIIKNLELPFRSLSFELTYEQACEAAIKYCLENLI